MTAFTATMPVFTGETTTDAFVSLPERIQHWADVQGGEPAIYDDGGMLTWGQLADEVNRIANRLRAAGLQRGDTVAGLSENSARYLAVFLGTLTAGGCMVPLSGMAASDTLALMVNDCDARFLFASSRYQELVNPLLERFENISPDRRIGLDFDAAGWTPFSAWTGDASSDKVNHKPDLDDPFNIIYSSGTTGTPKGILHDHRFRAQQMEGTPTSNYNRNAVTLISTPLYSNTTLVSALPTLYNGGIVVLMAKFDAYRWLQLAEQHRVTHTMLVPVQYQRILNEPEFDNFDLSHFKMKFSTSAPLRADVIADAMRRWPGNIIESYGLTEGGVKTSLNCAENPGKWDTVGRPGPGCELRVVDDDLQELPAGEVGEIVGRSTTMMRGYYKREEKTRELVWTSPEGKVFYRTGDLGRLDEDGFLQLLDRRKDMIISGGFNVYAEDLERVLMQHPDVTDAAVIAIPSGRWGETPLGLVVRREEGADAEIICDWANAKLGKNQRLSRVEFRVELPRSGIGKILKRELREPYWEDGKYVN